VEERDIVNKLPSLSMYSTLVSWKLRDRPLTLMLLWKKDFQIIFIYLEQNERKDGHDARLRGSVRETGSIL